MFVRPMNTSRSRGSVLRRLKVSGFAEGFRLTSGEYSWIWRAKPCDSTPNRAFPPFFSAGTRSEPYSPWGSMMTHVTLWRSSSSMRTPSR